MKKKLETRKSAQYLLSLEVSGRLDSRSELGTVVHLDEWQQKPTVQFHCECEQVRDNEELIPSHIIITDIYLYILRHTEKKNTLVVRARRTLKTIMKITTKAKMADVVKLQYGSKGDNGEIHITDSDRLHIPGKAGAAIKAIKSILQPSKSQRRSSVAVGLQSPKPSLSARRPSLIAEERRSSLGSDDGLSLQSLRRPSASSHIEWKPSMEVDRRLSEDGSVENELFIPLIEMRRASVSETNGELLDAQRSEVRSCL